MIRICDLCGGGRTNRKYDARKEKERRLQRSILDAARSGVWIGEFCCQRRIMESRFYSWQGRLKAGFGGGKRSKGELQRGEGRVFYW